MKALILTLLTVAYIRAASYEETISWEAMPDTNFVFRVYVSRRGAPFVLDQSVTNRTTATLRAMPLNVTNRVYVVSLARPLVGTPVEGIPSETYTNAVFYTDTLNIRSGKLNINTGRSIVTVEAK